MEFKQSPVSKARPGRMPWLRLHLTNLCNFNCPGCHVFKISPNTVPATNMPYAIAEKAIIYFVNQMKKYLPREKEFYLSIYGGEPLLNRLVLYKLLENYSSNFQGIKANWIVNTNGSLLNKEDLKFFIPPGVDIHLSVDGKEAKHNKTRIDKLGRKTFNRVMQAIDLIKENDYPNLQFDSVANPYELETMNEVIEVANDKGVRRIHFDLFYSPQYPQDFSLRDYSQKYAQAYNQGKERAISIFSTPFSQIYSNLLQNVKISPISGAFPTLEFFADGSFIFGELPLIKPFDNLSNIEQDDVWNRRMKLLLEMEKENEMVCGQCYLLPYCKGSMRRIFHYHTLTRENEDNICDIARETVRIFQKNNFIPLGYAK